MRIWQGITLALLISGMLACTTHKSISPSQQQQQQQTDEAAPGKKRRYSLLEDQGPDTDIDVTKIPDATPKNEQRTIAGNMTPYTVLGKTYSIQFNTHKFSQTGYASWYGKKFHGERTSNGEIYNMFAMTAAHKTLPIPCYVRVTNVENKKSVILRVNDRGPFHDDRIIDLTYTAAKKLGYHQAGVARVQVDVINIGDTTLPPVVNFKPMLAAASPIKPVRSAATSVNAPPPVKPDVKPIAVAASSKQIADAGAPTYLQVGSFGSQAGAETLQKSLRGLTAYPIVLMPVPGKNLFRVLVGPFVQPSEIQALKAQLIAKNLSTPYVVQGGKRP